jgi:hypothetical protein
VRDKPWVRNTVRNENLPYLNVVFRLHQLDFHGLRAILPSNFRIMKAKDNYNIMSSRKMIIA